MRTGVIYKATNLVNGNFYIGKTIDFSMRIKKHLSMSFNEHAKNYNTYFHNAIRKYGKENFGWEVLYNNIPESQLNVAEICAIYICEPKYNMTEGGDGHNWKGKKHSEETKKRMSVNNIWNNEEKKEQHRIFMRKLMSGSGNPRFGKKDTEERRRKKSILMSGERNYFYGKYLSEKERDELSILRGGKSFDVFKKDTGEYVGTWTNRVKCAKDLNINRTSINSCLNKQRNIKSVGGYIFKFVEKNNGISKKL